MSIFGSDYKGRKNIPVFDLFTGYFPKALREVARVCVGGNQQHNPGERLHWARGKSMDQMNTAQRHMIDHGTGEVFDETDSPEVIEAAGGKLYHLAKAIWRLAAELELTIEKQEATPTLQEIWDKANQSAYAAERSWGDGDLTIYGGSGAHGGNVKFIDTANGPPDELKWGPAPYKPFVPYKP